jgi:transposase
MRNYIGVDWADAAHAIYVEDDVGALVLSRAVPDSVEAFAEWGRWLDERRAAGIELWAAIERPDGRVVNFLLDHDVLVFPVNPKALERARDRFRMSGAKSDPFDARVAATFLRTDHAHLQPLRPSSEAAAELKDLTRDYARQVRQQTRLLNQLTVTLKEYYPRALEVCGDLKPRWAQEFLRAFPTPETWHRLNERQWQRWTRTHRLSHERTAELWRTIARPQHALPAHVVRTKARRLTVLLDQLVPVAAAVEMYRQAVHDFFAHMPAAQWASSLPGGGSGTTVPRVWAELGDATGRWQTVQHLQGQAGTVPVTEKSGKTRVIKFRFACNTHLRDAIYQLAFVSLRQSEWARRYYDHCRRRGHSHHHALRALGGKWVKIIFAMWTRHTPYDEQHHLASIARHQLRQPV